MKLLLEVAPHEFHPLGGNLEATPNILRISLIDEIRFCGFVRFEVANDLRKFGILPARIRYGMIVRQLHVVGKLVD